MKFYISAHNRDEAAEVAGDIRNAGHDVTSTWHDEPFRRRDEISGEECRAIASRNSHQISNSHALVLVASNESVPGGKFVEAGIAIGQEIPVVVLGHIENILLHHPLVMQTNLDDFVEELKSKTR